MKLLILGCGYTGRRVAERFRARGYDVTGTNRSWTLEDVRRSAAQGGLVLHSVPPEGSAGLVEALGGAPSRVVYLSTTGVYGRAHLVDESTPADPNHPRVCEERRVAAGPWSSLILRPAAIYGPGRGVHERLRSGACDLGENYVSRIHVDDLASHAEAALLSDLSGAYPVADEEPCTSREIAEFCAQLMGLPMPAASEPRIRSNRRVDGSAIRRALGVTLRYRSYRDGIPASIGERA